MDSVSLRQDSFYEKKGITALSNDNTVVPRNLAGNVLVQTTSSLLVIEAITTNVLAESVLPLLDTQFNYFKFPARTAIVDETLDLDLDLNLDLSLELESEIATVESNIPLTPSTYKPSANQQVSKISKDSLDGTKTEAQIVELSNVTQGPPQQYNNAFTITQDLIEQGKDLKVTGVITTQYNSNRNSEVGFFFGLGKNGEITDLSSVLFTNFFTPDDVNNKNQVTKEGIYTTNIDETISNASLVALGAGTDIFLRGFAEDQQENRNHTILANSTFIKFESV
jgi:hypothetical protein